MVGTDSYNIRSPSSRLNRKLAVFVGISVSAVLATVAAVAAIAAGPSSRSSTSVTVPGLDVTVSQLPSAWSMRPNDWVLTRAETGEVLAATSTWWSDTSTVDDHNTFEVCVERMNQSTCPTNGPLVVSVDHLQNNKRASISIVERSPAIADTEDSQLWLEVVFK